jgi:hypothetical protein
MKRIHVIQSTEEAVVGPWTGRQAHVSRAEGSREALTTTPTLDEIDS